MGLNDFLAQLWANVRHRLRPWLIAAAVIASIVTFLLGRFTDLIRIFDRFFDTPRISCSFRPITSFSWDSVSFRAGINPFFVVSWYNKGREAAESVNIIIRTPSEAQLTYFGQPSWSLPLINYRVVEDTVGRLVLAQPKLHAEDGGLAVFKLRYEPLNTLNLEVQRPPNVRDAKAFFDSVRQAFRVFAVDLTYEKNRVVCQHREVADEDLIELLRFIRTRRFD